MRSVRPRALDLFCCAGGVSVGLARAGFEVTGVDSNPKVEPYWRRGIEPYGGEFHCADALTFPLDGYDLICASPPCQRFSSLRHLHKGKDYSDLIGPTTDRLMASGALWCIENVEGAPLGAAGFLIVLCGTMFGLQTPDGRAEIRRHRLFETSFSIPLRPACQHGEGVLHVTGHGVQDESAHSRQKRRHAMSITGNTPQTNVVRNQVRETFSADDARAAMGIDWMPMRYLSQAIPPAYSEWIGRQALQVLQAPEPVQQPKHLQDVQNRHQDDQHPDDLPDRRIHRNQADQVERHPHQDQQ